MATFTFYNKWKLNQLNGGGTIDFDTDTVKVMLTTSTYSPSATTDDFKSDVTNEVSGTNYTAGGNTLTITVSETGGTATVDPADTTWTASGTGFSNARYAVIYKDTGTPATSPLVGYIDFVSDQGNTGADLTLQFNASGLFTLS